LRQVLRDFPECEKMEAQLFALIDLMSGAPNSKKQKQTKKPTNQQQA